ncbi:MAG: transposase [Acidobacteria bacterium]|nr:transposase [Acidobacteriota bacterium]
MDEHDTETGRLDSQSEPGDGGLSPHWPHAPLHLLKENGTYMVTAGTYGKILHFTGSERLDLFQEALLRWAHSYSWCLEAWAIFPNHYHFVAQSPEGGGGSLSGMLGKLHSETSRRINRLDGIRGRKVWHNFFETLILFEKSYFARLHYVHANPVHHRLVTSAARYPWCSAAWFEREATPSQVKTIYSFRINQLDIPDDF